MPAARSVRTCGQILELRDSVLGGFFQPRGVTGDRTLAHAIRLRHATVERLDQLVQVREYLLAVGFGCRWLRRLVGRSLALPVDVH